ncbi:MAG: organomercurial lyase [Deferrisomatales bacterium]
MKVEVALQRLQEILPLAERRGRLAAPVAAAHREILRTFAERGRLPTAREVAAAAGAGALAELARNDLVVLGADGEITGAYPMTTAETPHRVRVNGHALYAMCALDALAVAPMFGAEVETRSACHVTGAPIRVVQRGEAVTAADPPESLHVGVRWGPVGGTAAGSL